MVKLCPRCESVVSTVQFVVHTRRPEPSGLRGWNFLHVSLLSFSESFIQRLDRAPGSGLRAVDQLWAPGTD